MKYKLHIPYVNREDLLRQAVQSLRDIGHIHIWCDGVPAPEVEVEQIHLLPALSFTAVMNCLIKNSLDDDDDVFFFAHNDCLARNDAAGKFLRYMESRFASKSSAAKWGMIQTQYDVLCCFNCAAVREVGWFDAIFNWYVSDVDFYRRIRLAGWPIEQFPCEIIHVNDASNTIKADAALDARTQFRTKTDRDYYRYKWGGDPGQEKYSRPFEGAA